LVLTLRSHVSTESRYGMYVLALRFVSASAEITLPSVSRLLLMLTPSFSRAPLAQVWLTRSEPAKSTRLILLRFVCFTDAVLLAWSPSSVSLLCTISAKFNTTEKIECERELLSFIPVAAVAR
uniref:Uncharacterized protein n=1 Tax=Anopheles coluzzii TaxID=1518534 RepID=A0A8W7PEN2_ANOCL